MIVSPFGSFAKSFLVRLVAVAALALVPTTSQATNHTLNMNNANDNSFQFGIAPLAAITGPVDISGTIDVDATEVAGEITSIEFLGGDLVIADTTITDSVLLLGSIPGTLSVTFTGVHFSVVGGPFPVGGSFFNPTGLLFILNQGILSFSIDSDLTGLIPGSIDLTSNPQTITAAPSTREGSAFPELGSVNLYLPMDAVSETVIIENSPVFFVFSTTLTSVPVPEVSPMILAGIGAVGLMAAARRRRASV